MYTIEWQKWGLPRAHIQVWLKEKIPLDKIHLVVRAELPNPKNDFELFQATLNKTHA
jgi:hypothetical protein